jgi:hypothetical protein
LRKKVNEKLKKGYVLANTSVSAWRSGKFEYDLKVAFSRFLAAVKLDSTRIRDIKELARKSNWELSHSPTAGKVVKKGRIPTRISIMSEADPEKPSTAPEEPSTRLKTILEYRKKAAKISI